MENKKKIRILLVASDLQGVGHFRNIWPAQSLEKYHSDDFEVEINSTPKVENIEYMSQFDIIHFHRHLGAYETSSEVWSKLKEAGCILIMDIDDYWIPPVSHPLYEMVMKDGLSDKILNNIKLADYITTTTDIFASYIKPHNPNVHVIPNALDMTHKMWKSEVNPIKSDKCRIAWIGGSCYDKDTEILTENGFKFFKDLNEEEKVACLNPENNNLEYHKPLGYIKEPYKGKLQCGKNNLLDYAVTPNHNMYVSEAKNLNQKELAFELTPSEDVFGKNLHFKKDANWNGVNQKYFVLPKISFENEKSLENIYPFFKNNIIEEKNDNYKLVEEFHGETGVVVENKTRKKVRVCKSVNGNYYLRKQKNSVIQKYSSDRNLDMNLWLKFFGFWIAEGWTTTTSGLFQVGICQSKNNDYLKVMFDTLVNLGFNPKYTKDKKQIRVFDKQLWEYLNKFGKAQNKYVPKEILNLPKEQLNIFLDWYLKGDGTHETGGQRYDKRLNSNKEKRGIVSYNSNRRRGYTSSKKLADNIQEICLKVGVISTITNRGLRNSIMSDGRYVSANHDSYMISVGSNGIRSKKTPLLKSEDQFESEYDDFVYCVNVPNNIIQIRRNGKTMWCGNSHLKDLEKLAGPMKKLHSTQDLKDKFQIVMCGFDTRGSITEIGQNGERRTRAIRKEETVWRQFESILTGGFIGVKDDVEYKKWLDKIKKEDYPGMYESNYLRRWTLPLTQYGKHYDYCDVCLAPLEETENVYKKNSKDPNSRGTMISQVNYFNEVKSELKIIEAGMKRKALIAQDFGIYREILKDGETGILVKNDKKDWYKAMRKVIEDPTYRQQLANNLHDYVMERYELKHVTDQRADWYKAILIKDRTK